MIWIQFTFLLILIPFAISALEPCKPVNSQWKVGNTNYWSIRYKTVLYAYSVCKGVSPASNMVACRDGFWEHPLPECESIAEEKCKHIHTPTNVVKNCGSDNSLKIGTLCTFRCRNGYRLFGSSQRRCGSNLRWTGTNSFCVDINECKINNGDCSHKCNNLQGNFYCSCPRGFELDENRKSCNINECFMDNGGCSHGCSSTRGTHQCLCPKGYKLDIDRKTCIDEDECLINNGGCSHECSNRRGTYECLCPKGYNLDIDRKTCIDVDDCRDPRLHRCSQNCHNTEGGHYCSCTAGFVLIDGHKCEDIDECLINNGGCSHECSNRRGTHQCLCPKGYKLDIDRKTCIDVDECGDPRLHKCNQNCHNTEGGHFCSCTAGFILINGHKCEACRRNSYRSEKDSLCVECPPNSFTNSTAKPSIEHCHCASGFTGNPSLNIPCTDVDECLVSNFGCSHTCVNTPGSAHCSCPLGFQTKDDKTCVDIDECKTHNGGCEMHCENTAGSFTCSCSSGYTLSQDNYNCKDVNECNINNGGCSDKCNNFPGGYFCSCPEGYRLNVEGKICKAVRCPSLALPHNSTLRCFGGKKSTKTSISRSDSRDSDAPKHHDVDTVCRVKCSRGFKLTSNTDSVKCLKSGFWDSPTPQCKASHCPPLEIPDHGEVYPPECTEEHVISVKQKCYFSCNPGYHIAGKSFLKCKNSLTWDANPPVCQLNRIEPFIQCPSDIAVELKANESVASISVPQPITNVDEVEVFPDWVILNESTTFPSGKTIVLLKANSFHFNLSSECNVTVNVIDKEPPVFLNCPQSFRIDGVGFGGVLVYWDEPTAEDNIGIDFISQNMKPNTTVSAGIHYVEYVAKDAAGNEAKCTFQINIQRAQCEDLDDPLKGQANCMDWLLGKLCRPICESGYERDPNQPKFFACGEAGNWTPTNIISPCQEKCHNGTTWSSTKEICEENFIS